MEGSKLLVLKYIIPKLDKSNGIIMLEVIFLFRAISTIEIIVFTKKIKSYYKEIDSLGSNAKNMFPLQ